jgi:hypothetical protein
LTEILVSRILNALLKKGFIEDRTHHSMMWFAHNGRKTNIHTWFSYGRKKADDSLLRLIARELGVTRKELLEFVECTLSEDAYAALLMARGYLRRS